MRLGFYVSSKGLRVATRVGKGRVRARVTPKGIFPYISLFSRRKKR